MKVLWSRGHDDINFDQASIWYCLGIRGAAKSTFLEHLGMNYLEHGSVIFDLFGSKDGEGLAWLRSPYAKDKKILLVKGENVDVQCSFEVKPAEMLTLNDLESYDIIISANPLYLNFDQEFSCAAKIMDLMYKRFTYKRLLFVLCREAANLYYSRLKISNDQTLAKAQTIYLLRESLHMGLSLALDSVKFTAVDSDIRGLTDYLILKSQGLFGLPVDLKWLYSVYNPFVLRNMPRKFFGIVCKTGALGLGEFPPHEWHKERRENIIEAVGLKIERGEPIEEGKDKGTFQTVGDKEHIEIIRLTIEDDLGMGPIAEKLHRSTATIERHINFHNGEIGRISFCSRCSRARGTYRDTRAERKLIREYT